MEIERTESMRMKSIQMERMRTEIVWNEPLNVVFKCLYNETKLTSGNAFIVDLFVLGCEKGSKYEKITIFWRSTQKLYLSLNPYSLQMTYISKIVCIFSKRLKDSAL